MIEQNFSEVETHHAGTLMTILNPYLSFVLAYRGNGDLYYVGLIVIT